MDKAIALAKASARRRKRVRKRIFGTADRPRLNVFKSNKSVYAQIIDDVAGRTILAAGGNGKEFRGIWKGGTKVDMARAIGLYLGQKAKEAGIHSVVFDRGSSLYHGRVRALAEGCREAGLEF